MARGEPPNSAVIGCAACICLLLIIGVITLIVVAANNNSSTDGGTGTNSAPVHGRVVSAAELAAKNRFLIVSEDVPVGEESVFETESSARAVLNGGSPTPKPTPSPPSAGTVSFDYVIVGQGSGGVQTEYFLARALKRAGIPVSVGAFEAAAEVGGNVRAIKLRAPPNYDGSFGANLWGDLGAQRTTQMTLGMKRRMIAELKLPLLQTPFKNDVNTRGRRLVCQDPSRKALAAKAALIADGGDPNTNDGIGSLAFSFGDICTYNETFIDGETGAFIGLQPPGNPLFNDDPSLNAYEYLLHNGKFLITQDEPDLNTGAYDFYTSEGDHPINGRLCTTGSDCPFDVAGPALEWKSHVAFQLSQQLPGFPVLNYNYSKFMENDNVGFMGDYRRQFGAKSYSDYNLREWANTNGVNGYIPGGERRFIQTMLKNATDNGVQLFTNERVISVNSGSGGSGAKFVLKTSKGRTVNVRKFLFLNLPPFFLQNHSDTDPIARWEGEQISGNVINQLRQVRELKQPDPQRVVRILVQHTPGRPAWFWQLFDQRTGNHSYRQFGDTGCFSRTEFIDTPYHRCTNHYVPVYTDDECQELWLSYAEEANRTGDFALFKQRVTLEMRSSFPEIANIPEPELVALSFFPSAWHWGKRSYDDIQNFEVTRKAANPLNGQPLALIAEAYVESFQGWQEACSRGAKRALLTRLGSEPGVGPALQQIFNNLFNIAREPETGEISDASPFGIFGYQPPLYNPPNPAFLFPNERWW